MRRLREPVPHRLHGSVFHSYAAPARGDRELCAWRLEVAPGTPGQPHRISREEVFLLLTGALTVTVDGESYTMEAGSVVVVPAGSELCVTNDSAAPATMWVTTSVGLEATMRDGSIISPPWVR